MHLFSRLSTRLLGCCAAGLLLLACAGTTAVQAASGNLEVDVVFPHNDTYSPQPIIPIAFAFQNSALAGFLQPKVNFLIYPYGNYTKGIAYGSFHMEWTNFTKSDPYMLYGKGIEVLNTEGVWILEWILYVTNCSSTNGKLDYTLNSARRQIVFTTKNGAKRPDLTDATGADTCANAHAYAFEITETKDTGDFYDNGRPCAVLAETTPTPSPCAVKIDAAAAASVSASMTNGACIRRNATWCPEPEDDSAAHGLVVPSLAVGAVALLAAAVGGLRIVDLGGLEFGW